MTSRFENDSQSETNFLQPKKVRVSSAKRPQQKKLMKCPNSLHPIGINDKDLHRLKSKKKRTEENEMMGQVKVRRNEPLTNERVERLRKTCDRLRSLTSSDRTEVLSVQSLDNIPKGTLLEITEVEFSEDENGKYSIAEYSTTLPDNTRQKGKVRITENTMNFEMLKSPCIALYRGLKTSPETGWTYHNILVSNVDANSIKDSADAMRSVRPSSLPTSMAIQTMDDFEPGTVFIFKGVRPRCLKKYLEKVVMVSYETVGTEGEIVTGEVGLPTYLRSELKRIDNGILIYNGKSITASGSERFDVTIVGDESIIHPY